MPSLLKQQDVVGRTVVVFDVLRATTTMAAAFNAGATEIRFFASLDAARLARASYKGQALLVGETQCEKPHDFDLGNSPREFTSMQCKGMTLFMSTTNGTRAMVAARNASRLFAGSTVNASATATAIRKAGLPVTLLCAGTEGEMSLEDLIGCGTVLCRMEHLQLDFENDAAVLAADLALRDPDNELFEMTQAAERLSGVNLDEDTQFASITDRFEDLIIHVTDRDGTLVATSERIDT